MRRKKLKNEDSIKTCVCVSVCVCVFTFFESVFICVCLYVCVCVFFCCQRSNKQSNENTKTKLMSLINTLSSEDLTNVLFDVLDETAVQRLVEGIERVNK